jgi:hypothetical protein
VIEDDDTRLQYAERTVYTDKLSNESEKMSYRKQLRVTRVLVNKFTSLQVYKKNGAKRCYPKSVTFVTFLKQIAISC